MESTSVDPRHDARIFCDEPKGLRLGWHCSSWTRAGDRAAQRKPDLQPATMALVLRGARAAGLLKQAANAPLTQVRPNPDPTPRRFPRARIGLNTHTTCPFPNSRAAQVGGVRRFGVTTAGRAGHGLARPRARGPHVGGAPRNPRTRPRTRDRPARTTRETHPLDTHPVRPAAFLDWSRRPPSGRALTSSLPPSSPRSSPRSPSFTGTAATRTPSPRWTRCPLASWG